MARWLVALALILGPTLGAQQPTDSTGGPPPRLLQEFRKRWHEHVQQELALTPDQATKLQATEDRFAADRRPIAQSQRQVQQALREQLRPGAAADADSVTKLLAARDQGRTALMKLEQDEDQEMAGYLTPVQRARYQMMRQQLQERISEMRRHRRDQMLGPRDRDGGPPP
ncbi:MAG TPA: Spy/CpxP family protein refolding chaperone [Gemmatimonadales bacterium]|nr:Spy/CpxP family protein refolding chaperone [Gemmatimonadales bacterium]